MIHARRIAQQILVLKESPKSRKQRKLKKRKKQRRIDIYVVRVNKTGKLMNSKPCAECTNAMKYAGVNKVFYSTSDGTIISEKVKYMKSDHLSYQQSTELQTGKRLWHF